MCDLLNCFMSLNWNMHCDSSTVAAVLHIFQLAIISFGNIIVHHGISKRRFTKSKLFLIILRKISYQSNDSTKKMALTLNFWNFTGYVEIPTHDGHPSMDWLQNWWYCGKRDVYSIFRNLKLSYFNYLFINLFLPILVKIYCTSQHPQ